MLTIKYLSTNLLKRISENKKAYCIEINEWEVWIPTSQIKINESDDFFSIDINTEHSFKLQGYHPLRNKIISSNDFIIFLTKNIINNY